MPYASPQRCPVLAVKVSYKFPTRYPALAVVVQTGPVSYAPPMRCPYKSVADPDLVFVGPVLSCSMLLPGTRCSRRGSGLRQSKPTLTVSQLRPEIKYERPQSPSSRKERCAYWRGAPILIGRRLCAHACAFHEHASSTT
eukprot:3516583-Rhodomonas_salina.1